MTVTHDIDVSKKGTKAVSVFDSLDTWFEDMWKNPLSLLRRPLFPELAVGGGERILPSVDIFDEGGALVLKADLPGLEKEDITLEIKDGVLTLTGEKKRAETVDRSKYYRFERTHGRFTRRFQIPANSDISKVTARYESGVLEVRIPKAEPEVKHARKISIN